MTGHENTSAEGVPDNVARKLHDVLSGFFREDQGVMVMKWALQVEAIEPDGNSAMWTLSSPDMALWERQSFTRYALRYYDFLQVEAHRGGED